MQKVTLTVPTMGSYWPHLKNGIKAQFITIFSFSPNNILQHGLYSNIDRQTQLCLGTFKYTEADKEIYRKWITKSKQYSTTHHVWVSDYFTHSIIICRYLFITLRYVTLRTLQYLTIYIYRVTQKKGNFWEIQTCKTFLWWQHAVDRSTDPWLLHGEVVCSSRSLLRSAVNCTLLPLRISKVPFFWVILYVYTHIR
jgi:hypothetical protein